MKDFFIKNYNYIFYILLGMSVSFSFGIGFQKGRVSMVDSNQVMLSKADQSFLENKEIKFMEETPVSTQEASAKAAEVKGLYVGSKNGTKYYTPGCAGTNRIKPENYIWFQSVEDATLQGYTKGSC